MKFYGMRYLVAASFVLISVSVEAQLQRQVDRHFYLRNYSSSPIKALYAQNREALGVWNEPDHLARYLFSADETIPYGRGIRVDVSDGSSQCFYDLKAVLLDGREATVFSFDVCRETAWIVNDRTAVQPTVR